MSAGAAPAAEPGPNDPPANTPASSPRPGLLASMLTPVDPARPTFNLTPQTTVGPATGTSTGTPVEGVSSASYHGTEDTPNTPNTPNTPGKTTGSGTPQKGIWRAWMLAGAARWARGGGLQNKRLDAKKAAAQARQVKETRQVSVNKSGGLGVPSGASGAGGKSLGSKSTKDGAVKGPKNSPAGAGKGPSSRSDSGGPGSGGSAGGRRPSRPDPSGSKGDGGTHKTKPDNSSRTPKRTPGPAGPNGAPATGASSGGSSKTPHSTTGDKHGKQPATKDSPTKHGKQPTPATGKNTTPNGGTGPAGGPGKNGTPGKGSQPTAKGTVPAKTDPSKPNKSSKPAAPTKTDLHKKQHPDGKTTTKQFTTRESRETGYRDGTLAAKTYAHTKAYRDGVKDGWVDTTEVADREKARLDKAHQDRKKARQEPPVTTASSTDHHPAATPDAVQPIKVDRIDATHLHLGDGAARTTISRGEVRSLKQYERRLTERLNNLQKVAETTKQLQAHAEAQAQNAQNLLEKTRGVKGGDKLAGKLARLHEDAKTQATEAGEIHKRAVRSADTCGALVTNVNTRYSDMYQAVIDSPETVPAELAYYQGN